MDGHTARGLTVSAIATKNGAEVNGNRAPRVADSAGVRLVAKAPELRFYTSKICRDGCMRARKTTGRHENGSSGEGL